MIFFYECWKKDCIKIENDLICCRGNLKNYSFYLKEIESCEATNFYLQIKRKNDLHPIRIMFITNAHDIASYIEKNKD